MVKVEIKRICAGHDCWGRPEYDDIYVVTDKQNNIIYQSKDDPTKLIEYLSKELVGDNNDF